MLLFTFNSESPKQKVNTPCNQLVYLKAGKAPPLCFFCSFAKSTATHVVTVSLPVQFHNTAYSKIMSGGQSIFF